MKIHQTKEWREKRAKYLKGKTCEWCGSTENLAVHHVNPPPLGLGPYKQIATSFFNEYFSDGKHFEELTERWREAEKENHPRYHRGCPKCKSRSIYTRKTKTPKWRCNQCGYEFKYPKIITRKNSNSFIKRRIKFHFQQEHKEEIQFLYEEYKKQARAKYLDFENQSLMALCKRCHYAIKKGLILCKKCKKHYHKKRYDKCWKCFTKTERGKEVVKKRKKLDEDLIKIEEEDMKHDDWVLQFHNSSKEEQQKMREEMKNAA